uniref:EGF-like domain-containing protein n=1 Tax=Steinernema glaseri TaxID=37863 RepID=A0A1I7YHI5_9BILA
MWTCHGKLKFFVKMQCDLHLFLSTCTSLRLIDSSYCAIVSAMIWTEYFQRSVLRLVRRFPATKDGYSRNNEACSPVAMATQGGRHHLQNSRRRVASAHTFSRSRLSTTTQQISLLPLSIATVLSLTSNWIVFDRRALIMQLSATIVLCALLALGAYAKIQAHPAGFNLSCLNGGSIKEGKCICSSRFEGEHCEIEPCLNGGVKSHNGKCHCPFGLMGDQCDKVTHCSSNGQLTNGTCKCEPRWGGIFCNVRTCHNGISVGGEHSFCMCDLGFTGPFCDVELKCTHGSINQNNKCQCDSNWVGAECDQCVEGFYQLGQECLEMKPKDAQPILHPKKLGQQCLEMKPKDAQPILHPKKVPVTSIVLIGGVCSLLVVVVGVSLFFVMKKRTKPSPSNSERASATDV